MRRWLAQHLLIGAALTTVLVLIGTVGVWAAVVHDQRSDTDRCPSISGASPAGVVVGGWGTPDECTYVDESGEAVHPDARFAGAVRTTPFREATALGAAGLGVAFGVLALNARLLRTPATGAEIDQEPMERR